MVDGVCVYRELFNNEFEAAKAYDREVKRLRPHDYWNYINLKEKA